MQTVYTITEHPLAVYTVIPALFGVGGGIVALAASVGAVRWLRHRHGPPNPVIRLGAFFVFGTLMSLLGWLLFLPHYKETQAMVDAYREGNYRVSEGRVTVLRKQPWGGHAAGDLIRINDGTELEVDYFSGRIGYQDTIAHGGVLREGVHARVYHHAGVILRVDVRANAD